MNRVSLQILDSKGTPIERYSFEMLFVNEKLKSVQDNNIEACLKELHTSFNSFLMKLNTINNLLKEPQESMYW